MTRRTMWIIGWVVVAFLVLLLLAWALNTPVSSTGVNDVGMLLR